MDEKEIVTKQIQDLIQARKDFFATLDKIVPKVGSTDVFDFDACEDKNLKEIYSKFYPYDYAIRRLLPLVYEKFGVKFNV